MKNSVLCFVAPVPAVDWTDVMMVEKNLPGGEVLDGEMPEQAAYRILQDFGILQAGHISLADTRIMGVIHTDVELIHVCRCPVRGAVRSATGGAGWVPLEQVMQMDYALHSAKLAIALCRSGLTKWAFCNCGSIVSLDLEGAQ